MAGGLAERLEARAPWVAGAMLALPVLAFRYPPMGDLASHEALVFILRHFGEARYFPEGLYERSLGQPNQLFHLLAWLLSLAMPTDMACKLVVAGAMLGTSVAAGHLAAHLRVTRWAALLVAPLALGWMFRWGLVGNMVGFALWLAALPSLDRLARDPSPARALRATALAVLLYFAHESSMAMYAVASVVLAVQTPRRLRSLALAACPGAAAVLLAALYAVRSEPLKAASILAVGAMRTPFVDKLTGLAGALFSARWASLPLLIASLGAMGSLGWERINRKTGRLEGEGDETNPPSRLPVFLFKIPSRLDVSLRDARFAILALVLLALYFAMPLSFGGSTLIHQRFLAPAFAVAALAAAVPGRPTPRWAPALAAFPVAILAVTLGSFVEQDRSYRDLDVVLAQMDDGAAVAQLDLTPRAPGPMAPVVGPASRALAVHGGRLLFSFTDAPALPIKIPARYQWNEPVLRLAATPFAFMPTHDLLRFRYLLVYEKTRAMDDVLVTSLSPEARLLAKAGPWLLFESTLPRVPLTAEDAPLPSPAPEPLADRVRRALIQGEPR